jgi:cobalt/nickel transport system permease protein
MRASQGPTQSAWARIFESAVFLRPPIPKPILKERVTRVYKSCYQPYPMHIPDGYLSPSTCGLMYGLAAAGWYAALKRVKRVLSHRAIPLISVFAAFSFVVMMFNLPLPGGTTGHALGVTIAAIVLGPWGSILAISIALAVQALFFGDGGITTLGANAFNMAIIGSFVAYGVYRLISAGSQITSRRRVLAAAIAGYACVNASALITAIEFGIQPLLFHDQHGAPLYSPYPLHIAMPAMMIGHLTIAGVAEGIISAGMVSYLQRADVGLLKALPSRSNAPPSGGFEFGRLSAPRLWLAVALLMLLTPLGILAGGTAWGEWSSGDLADPANRERIAATSRDVAPPASAPRGLLKLSTIWTAPFPSYAPPFVKNPAFGYLMSAMFGVGLLALGTLAVEAARDRRTTSESH